MLPEFNVWTKFVEKVFVYLKKYKCYRNLTRT